MSEENEADKSQKMNNHQRQKQIWVPLILSLSQCQVRSTAKRQKTTERIQKENYY